MPETRVPALVDELAIDPKISAPSEIDTSDIVLLQDLAPETDTSDIVLPVHTVHPQPAALRNFEVLDPNHDIDIDIKCGQYLTKSPRRCLVRAESNVVKTEKWFQSPPLNDGILKRLNSIQLVTNARDQGSSGSPVSGNWSWFELSIVREDGSESEDHQSGVGHRWMSHVNQFMTADFERREGRVFTRQSELLKSLKPGDRVQAHGAACFHGVKTEAKAGCFVLDIGCEIFTRKPFRLLRDNAPQVVVAGDNQVGLHKLLDAETSQWHAVQIDQEGSTGASQGTDIPRKLLVLDDSSPGASQGVENRQNVNFSTLKATVNPQSIIHKTAWRPGYLEELAQWAESAEQDKRHHLVVFDAEDIPHSEEKIRRLSWDQTVENIWKHALREIYQKITPETTDPRVPQIQNEHFHVLIRIGFEGGIYAGFQKDSKPHLIYEPTSAKGGFLRSYSNGVLGKLRMDRKALQGELKSAWMAGLMASLAKESKPSMDNLCIIQIREAILTGIRWSRRFAAIAAPKDDRPKDTPTMHKMKFETDSDPALVSVSLELTETGDGDRELEKKTPLVLKSLPGYQAKELAWDITKKGPRDILHHIPTASFGNLMTADRGEIDGFRTIANSIEDYLNTTEAKPFPIAVFGQPGSGKSFGIKEVIKTILGANNRKIAKLEFNLSQFQSEEDLRHAFESIRDKGFSKEMPVVYFDEFDSTFKKQLGWLKHLIRPVEDGYYIDNGVPRPLGRGIYIFIGGTKTTYQEFFKDLPADYQPGSFMEFLQNPEEPGVINPSTPAFTEMELDLSEITEYDSLKKMFYQIRDETLSGNLPVVFFRNFDANLGNERLGWLKYFLSPMQDGEFFDHGSRRPIGAAVFVFVQGPAEHLTGFPDTVPNYTEFPGAKVPDFVSRLHGCGEEGGKSFEELKNIVKWYFDTKNENKPLSIGMFRSKRQEGQSLEVTASIANLPLNYLQLLGRFKAALKGQVDVLGPGKVDEDDQEQFPIRRAIMLRYMFETRLGLGKEQELKISNNVLNALLYTPKLLHGARSLGVILAMSNLSKDKTFESSDLPDPQGHQRKLHVAGKNPEEELDENDFDFYLGQAREPTLKPQDITLHQHYLAIEWVKRVQGETADGEGSDDAS